MCVCVFVLPDAWAVLFLSFLVDLPLDVHLPLAWYHHPTGTEPSPRVVLVVFLRSAGHAEALRTKKWFTITSCMVSHFEGLR